jgi:MoxR-like ATPase
VRVDPRILNYILDLVRATRSPAEYGLRSLASLIRYGASPRAAVHLTWVARAHAFLNRRVFVLPEDVRRVCGDVLRHRVLLTYEAAADDVTSDEVLEQILSGIDVP